MTRNLAMLGIVLALASVARGQPVPVPAPATERERWAVDFLKALGNEQPTPDTVAMVVAWQTEESTTAQFNPLATSQDMPNATVFNSHGVKEYATYQDGIAAAVKTLSYSYPGYSEVLEGLRTNDPERALAGLSASPWAAEGGYGERARALWGRVSLPKANVTPTMEVGAHFDTADCSVWGFQVSCQHWGTDLLGAEGTPVYAPFDLTVIALGEYGPGPTMGQYIQGTFSDGYVFYAGHLEGRQPMQVGDTLPAGALLGFTNAYAHTHIQLGPPGNTGPCAQYGSCLDFETYWRDR
jgi:murein DD-endopeptidase MepM/ murein hydrolase activator NlpD